MVLIIDESVKKSDVLSRQLYRGGVFNYASAFRNSEKELRMSKYDAILIPNPDCIPSVNEFCIKLRRIFDGAIILFKNNESKKTMFRYLESNSYISGIIDLPVSVGKMCEEILYLIRYNSKNSAIEKTAGCVHYNYFFDKNTVKIFGNEITLTTGEYNILKYLVLRYPDIISPDELIKFAFKPYSKCEINNVTVQISRLNKKLFLLAKYKVIENIYGKGYYITSKNEIDKDYALNVLKINTKL